MKKFLSFFLLLAASASVSAQARFTQAEYQKTMQPAVELDAPYPESVVHKAIEDRMQKMGYKGKEIKGYTMYSSVRLPEFANETYDLYLKARSKGRKDKNSSTLTLLVSSGYEKFLGESEQERVVSDAKHYLTNLLPAVSAYDLELQITEQAAATKKAEQKLEKLVNESNDLVKRKDRIEREIEENKKRQDEQRIEIENQRKIEETLKGKRMTRNN